MYLRVKSFIHSLNCQFFDRLTSYPSDVWVKIVARMNVNVFQYKLLVIPSTQDKSQIVDVRLGLHNVLDCGKNIGDCDHTCIIHLEVGKQVMNHSLVCKQDQATYEHALLNTRWTRK